MSYHHHLLHTSFSSWYPKLKSVCCSKSIVIHGLSEKFLSYLFCHDGVYLETNKSVRNDFSDESELSFSSSEEEEESRNETGNICHDPEIYFRIHRALEELGGKVFVKCNWHSPSDAKWITLNSSLLCQSVQDILLLLKSSDRVYQDYRMIQSLNQNSIDVQFELVLKKWNESLNPSQEFRVFIREKSVIAICQRNTSNYYPFIKESVNIILQSVVAFYTTIYDLIPELDKFILDVYISSSGRVYIIDINVWSNSADTLLFTHEELVGYYASTMSLPVFKYVLSEMEVQLPNFFKQNHLPWDLLEKDNDNNNNNNSHDKQSIQEIIEEIIKANHLCSV